MNNKNYQIEETVMPVELFKILMTDKEDYQNYIGAPISNVLEPNWIKGLRKVLKK